MDVKKDKLSNAKRFINAYNTIDYSLRTIYNMKRSLSFADAVRKAVGMNSVIRKYEEKLIDYGRLRNSIVHTSTDIIIAEPHDSVVEEIEKIAFLLSMPPLALPLCKQEVVGLEHDTSLATTLKTFYTTGYSNLPIYKNESIIGVANASKVANFIGKMLNDNIDIKNSPVIIPIEDVIEHDKNSEYFVIRDAELTVEEALNLFYNNRKLLVIIITKKGNFLEKPIGILTNGDVIDLNNILENY